MSVEFGDELDQATNARVRQLDRELARSPFDGFHEAVPTHRSLLVLHQPGLGFAGLARELLARAGRPAGAPEPRRRHHLPVAYGGEQGPDLEPLARRLGLTASELVRAHAGREYSAFMLGFTPGFAYLGLLPPGLEAPRHATPRVRVPAGSVGLAGRQTGVYPSASPGGWQLVGRCAVRLFDPLRPQPALIAPGDLVRFRSVPELEPVPPRAAAAAATAVAAIEVLEPGLLTTVQDAGRRGWRRIGVSGGGAADLPALLRANRALANPDHAAALECTLVGPALEFLQPVRFAIAGADLEPRLERADLGAWPVPSGAAVLGRPGNVLRFGGRRAGCRAVVAFEGGLEVPEVLGSRSTDLGSGFGGLGGRPLQAGDRLALGAARRRSGAGGAQPAPVASPAPTVRVVLGPQADQLAAESVAAFLGSPWRVGASSDRTGCRLEGPPLRHRGSAEILSDGMVPGSIQVPPDGRPILMLADAPTTGGYPKLATVLAADLPLVAQLVPGAGELRFEAIAIDAL